MQVVFGVFMVDSRPGPTVACDGVCCTVACDGVLLSELPFSDCTNLVTCHSIARSGVTKNVCMSRELVSVGADLGKQNLYYNTYAQSM